MGPMLLFLSDTNDDAPTLHPRSPYLEIGQYVGKHRRHMETGGKSWSLSGTFNAEKPPTWCYLVLLFIGDKQGLSQKQTVHERSYVRDQMSALSINTAEAGAKLGAKDLGEMLPSSPSASDQVHFVLGTLVYLDTVVPRGPLEVRVRVMAGMLSQQLGGTDIAKGDPGYPPHVYAEEGKCERVETRSSLAFSEHDLSPDLLDSLGPKAAPLEEVYSESGFRFLKTAYFGELE
ncbi:hypothetical protein BU61_3533 [Pontoporia blainvillei]|uniref:Uncharacterized protein n=1 Tax=Pontoporia blainvillei TaxID=48723 RepID=A0ABX0S461_PONBL|nr:hypothetical protein [Pontoporia blainvillei]